MEEIGSAASVLPGPSEPAFRAASSERRMRKSGSANIFQGVNLRQLRRLFHSAGEPDAEQKARQVFRRNHTKAEGRELDGDEEEGEEEEDEEGLAQALVGLRVRARTRSGIRAEASRGVRAFGHGRMSERSSSEALADDDEASLGACGGEDVLKSCDLEEEEEVRGVRKDAERYLHRIRH